MTDASLLRLIAEQFAPDVTAAVMAKHDLRGLFRARVNGQLFWACPGCYVPQSVNLRLGSYRIQCANNRCRRKYAFGHVLHLMTKSITATAMPADMIITSEGKLPFNTGEVLLPRLGEVVDALPAGEVSDCWRDDRAVHRVRLPEGEED